MIRKVATTSEKALQASYVVSLLEAKAKKPFAIVEELLLPAAKVLVETMIDKTAANKFNAVPLSNDTVSHRVHVMATDIVDQVVAKLTGSFALITIRRVNRRKWKCSAGWFCEIPRC